MAEILTLIDCASVSEGQSVEVVADGRIFAVFHVDGRFHVLDGICPHAGGPLGKGTLDGCVVTCPWHGWQFDVTSGRHQLSDIIRQPVYDVRIVDGCVCIENPNAS